MKRIPAQILMVAALIVVASSSLHAGPLGSATDYIKTELLSIARQAANWLGPLVTVYGGGRVSWEAAHGREFTKPLLAAIFGWALVATVGG